MNKIKVKNHYLNEDSENVYDFEDPRPPKRYINFRKVMEHSYERFNARVKLQDLTEEDVIGIPDPDVIKWVLSIIAMVKYFRYRLKDVSVDIDVFFSYHIPEYLQYFNNNNCVEVAKAVSDGYYHRKFEEMYNVLSARNAHKHMTCETTSASENTRSDSDEASDPYEDFSPNNISKLSRVRKKRRTSSPQHISNSVFKKKLKENKSQHDIYTFSQSKVVRDEASLMQLSDISSSSIRPHNSSKSQFSDASATSLKSNPIKKSGSSEIVRIVSIKNEPDSDDDVVWIKTKDQKKVDISPSSPEPILYCKRPYCGNPAILYKTQCQVHEQEDGYLLNMINLLQERGYLQQPVQQTQSTLQNKPVPPRSDPQPQIFQPQASYQVSMSNPLYLNLNVQVPIQQSPLVQDEQNLQQQIASQSSHPNSSTTSEIQGRPSPPTVRVECSVGPKLPEMNRQLSYIPYHQHAHTQVELPTVSTEVYGKQQSALSNDQVHYLGNTAYTTNSVLNSKTEDHVTTTNETESNRIILDRSNWSDWIADFHKFKIHSHCSQPVRVAASQFTKGVNKKSWKTHPAQKISAITPSMLFSIFGTFRYIRLTKIRPNQAALTFFRTHTVTNKRCLALCDNVVRGIALYEKDRELLSTLNSNVKNKKIRNVWTNYQRTDRSAGKALEINFLAKYNLYPLGVTAPYKEIEERANCSIDIYNRLGFLKYASPTPRERHIVFYDNGENMYLVREKYLDTFGKVPENLRKAVSESNSSKPCKAGKMVKTDEQSVLDSSISSTSINVIKIV